MRLALDNHYSPIIAQRLREAGHDGVAAVERGWEREDDERILALCAEEARALMTNDVADSWRFTDAGRRRPTHACLVYTSDASPWVEPRSADSGQRSGQHFCLRPRQDSNLRHTV